jgi:hypothetical protein
MFGKVFVGPPTEEFGLVRGFIHCALWKKNEVNTGLASDEARRGLAPNDLAKHTLQVRKWDTPRCINIFYSHYINPLLVQMHAANERFTSG